MASQETYATVGRAQDRQMTSGPTFLGKLRDRLLDQVLALLKADTAVDAVALIGSLGRGEADNWSDIDLLILMRDQALARFAAEPAARPWARAALLSDGRHNSPAGAVSVGTMHIRSGLPLRVDLHVHPQLGRSGRLMAASCSSAGSSRRGLRDRADRWVIMDAWPGGRPTGRGSMPRG
jgi:Nucleotidyltransferase domain